MKHSMEHTIFKFIDLPQDCLDNGHVVVDDEVEDGIEDVVLAAGEDGGTCLEPFTNGGVWSRCAVTYRYNVPSSHENVCLAKRDPPFHDLCRPRHDEQRVAVLLQLGVLMGLSGIFDGQRMKIELGLNASQ